MKPPTGPQFFKQRLGSKPKKRKNQPSVRIELKNDLHIPSINDKIGQQEHSPINKLGAHSKHPSQAEKDFLESVGSNLKHTINNIAHFSPLNNVRYNLTLKQQRGRVRGKQGNKKYSLSSKKYYEKEEKQLQSTIKSVQQYSNNDLYDTLSQMTPKVSMKKKENLHLNFVNMKQPVTQMRMSTTTQAKSKPLIKPFYASTPQQVQNSSQNLHEKKVHWPDTDQPKREIFGQQDFEIQQFQERSIDPSVLTKVLTNNNYSAMLNNIQKRKKLNLLEHRFLNTIKIISTLPADSRAEIMKNADTTLFQEQLINRIHSANKQERQSTSPQARQNIVNLGFPSKQDYAQQQAEQSGSPKVQYMKPVLSQSPKKNMRQLIGSKKNSVEEGNDYDDSQLVANKIKNMMNQASILEQKINENVKKSKISIVEADSKNPGEKRYQVNNEYKKIKQHFRAINGGLIATMNEELLQTRTVNHATYFYVNEEDNDVKKRKLEEEKLITDYVSERDVFIQKQQKTKRLTQSLQQAEMKSPLASPQSDHQVELGDLTLEEFLRLNKINPKIFTADTVQEHDKPFHEVKKLKPNTNKKHYYIQKSVLLIQTQKLTQARQFLINALKEFPSDVTLLFNKGLVHMLNKEYREALEINHFLLEKLTYKNAVLMNIFLTHLKQETYNDILELLDRIETSENFLDYDEKNLKKMYQFAREKLRISDYPKYEVHQKMLKDRRQQKRGSQEVKSEQYSAVDRSKMEVNLFDNSMEEPKREWSIMKMKMSKSMLKMEQPSSNPLVALMQRKASADTELSLKIKQGLAQYIAKKKTDHILKTKEDEYQKKYTEFKERASSNHSGSQHRKSIYSSSVRDDIVDRLYNDKIKQQEDRKKNYEGFQFDFANKNKQSQQAKIEVAVKAPEVPLFSAEFQQALVNIESEMQDNKDYFLSRLKKINNKVTELGPQFDPVQQEYDVIHEEVELLKKDIGGEEKLYVFIEQLMKGGIAVRKFALEKKGVPDPPEKRDLIEYQYKRLRQTHQRAIAMLLDTQNSLIFYKDKDISRHCEDKSRNIEPQITVNNQRSQSSKSQQKGQDKPSLGKKPSISRDSFADIEFRLNEYQSSKHETEEQQLIRILGISKDQMDERIKIIKGITGHVLMSKAERDQVQDKRTNEEATFDAKTLEFIDYLFIAYGLKEVIVPGTQELSLFKDVETYNQINTYIDQLSMYVTSRSSDLQNLHKSKTMRKSQKTLKDIPEEESDVNEEEKNQIEHFQMLLESKIMEKMGEQQFEESDFYSAMLQKLNAIDILQSYLKKCVKAVRNEEEQIIKKELSFAMLQIFREQISKKELQDRQRLNNIEIEYDDVDYEVIDKTIKRLKFFKIFDTRVRHKLYRICRYQIVPPNRVIVRKEEIESMIIVIVNGTASLMVQDNEQQTTYTQNTLFPGESLGDVNLTSTLKHKENMIHTYVKSDKECDVLTFDRQEFANVLFQEMKDSLYEKIITLKNSEFFESISPYALVILCSNIEIKEYSYGDVIVRQDQEPEFCYIIVSGECKLAYETVIFKTREEISGPKKTMLDSMHFGQQSFNPSDSSTNFKAQQASQKNNEEDDGRFQNQRKLNEKFSFQNERLDVTTGAGNTKHTVLITPQKTGGNKSTMGQSMMTDFMKKKQPQKEELLAFRHHIFYDKLVQGKCFCARSLLEKDYVRKFIDREFTDFKTQLQFQSMTKIPEFTRQQSQSNKGTSLPSFKESKFVKDSMTPSEQNELQQMEFNKSDSTRLEVQPMLKNQQHNQEFFRNMNNYSSKVLKREQLQSEEGQRRQIQTADIEVRQVSENMDNEKVESSSFAARDGDIKQMYESLMKSQLTVIADSASVKVIVISRKSKKYLSEPLKAIIDNKILNLKFKDYDRPFKNQGEIQKFLENEKNWEQYKKNVTYIPKPNY